MGARWTEPAEAAAKGEGGVAPWPGPGERVPWGGGLCGWVSLALLCQDERGAGLRLWSEGRACLTW